MSNQTTEGFSSKATKERSKCFARLLGWVAGLVAFAVSFSIGRYDSIADCTVVPSGLISWWRAEVVGAGQPSVLNFDDLPTTSAGNDWTVIPNGYGGLQWNNFGVLNGLNRPLTEGYRTGTVSPENVVFSLFGDPASLSRATAFTLTSAYLTAAFVNGLQIQVQGWAASTLVYSNVYTLSTTAPTLINFNYVGVDRVTFTPTVHSGFFALDNLAVKDPDAVLDSADGNHGTLLNGATSAAGRVGNAFSFDGVDDLVMIPRHTNLDVGNQVTIEFWMKADPSNALNSYQGLVTSDFFGIGIANGWVIGPMGVNFHISTDGGATLSPSSYPDTATVNGGGAPITAGEWHHIAGTYDGAKLQLYIDGQPWGNPNFHTGAISPMRTDSFVTIGAEDGRTICPFCVGARYFKGLIDEPAIYNRALSAAEIQAIYAAGSAGKCVASNPPPLACVPPPTGLVSWWRAEGNASDSTDGNPGSLQGGVSFGAGKVGQAFAFDGTNGSVTVPASANLNVGAGDGFSIDGWINPSTVELERPIVEWNSVTGGNPYPYGVHLWISVPVGYGAGPGCLYANVVDTAGAFHWLTSAGGLINTNAYQHVALSFDRTSGQALLYLDGAVVASKNLGSFTPQTSYNLYLGTRPGGEAEAFSWAGRMDEISLYNRTLSAAEIQAIYAAGRAGKCVVSYPPPSYLLAGPITNSANGHWYYLLDATNWPAAEQIGVSLGGHLATINNAAENEWVFAHFSIFNDVERALWIGLNDAGQENIWFWVSGQPVTYFNWAPGEPNNGGGFFADEDHTLMWPPSSGHPLGSWADAPSNQLHSAVIEIGPPEPVILAGPITNAMNSHWYYLLNYTNWPAAEQIAVSLGGHLATINNAAENNWVFDTFGTFGGLERAMWIGLNDSTLEGTWVWVSGEPVSYLNWSPIEPNSGGGVFPDEDHALMWHPSSGYPLGSWNDAPSNQLQYAVVEVAPPAPEIILQPTNVTVYVGSNATFRITATDDAPLSYQWRLNGNDLPGETSSVLSLTSVQFSNAGPYSVIVSNAGGSITSSNAVLTVNPLPNCAPPPAGLVSWWRWENHAIDSWGTNNAILAIGPGYTTGKAGQAISAQSGVQVPDSDSLRLTNALTLEAWVKPSSVSGATPRVIFAKSDLVPRSPNGMQSAYLLGLTNNGAVFFMVSATGSALTNTTLVTTQTLPALQWSFVVATYDGSALRIYINGALSAQTDYYVGIFPSVAPLGIGSIPLDSPTRELTWPFPGLLDEISLYNRALTDGEILAIFNADVVGKCLVAPTIVTQPQDQAVPLGEDAKFSVSVLGTRPLKYQWRIVTPANYLGTPILGATNSTLVLEKVKTNQAGTLYRVEVTNAVGRALSEVALLTLLPAPVCTDSPAGLISWWPADGSLKDVIGANDVLSTSLFATGKVNKAFSLNGVSSRLWVRTSSSLNFGSNANFSIETWIRALPPVPVAGGTNPNVPIIEKRTGASSNGRGYGKGYSLFLNDGRLGFWFGNSLYQSFPMFVSNGPDLRDNVFHHVAVTLDRSVTHGGRLYVDGEVVLTFDAAGRRESIEHDNPLFIGSPNAPTSSYFNGLIDEPAIYNRALSDAEILAIRNADAVGRCRVPPSILVQPASKRVTVGSNATFSVTASGSPALRYQWFRPFTDLGSIPEATNSAYTISNVSAGTYAGPYAVRVTNLFGSVMSSNVVLTINHPPTAYVSGQPFFLPEDTGLIFGTGFGGTAISAGSDIDNDPLSFIIVTPPTHGTITLTASNLIYQPTPNYDGPDSFSYKLNDGLADSGVETVRLNFLPVNDPPVAQSQSIALDEDTTAAITLGAFDVDGDPITFTVGAPTRGTLTGTPPNLTYLPNTNYFGLDSFTFSVRDGQTNSETATVSITVRPVNDPPVAEIVLAPLSHLPGVTNLLVIAPVGTNAVVILDGSRSTDVENDPLEYFWSEGTNTFATGVLATNQFALGLHDIALTVSDGQATGTNSVVLEVLSPAQAVGTLTVLVGNADLDRRNAKPLLASLQSAAASFERGNVISGVNELEAFQNKVQAQIAPLDPALAEALIEAAQEIIDPLSAPTAAGTTGKMLKDPTRLTGGKFQMRFNGPHGRTYFIEASTNLATWEIIGVARDAGQNLFDFEDVHAVQFPGRFYRVVSW